MNINDFKCPQCKCPVDHIEVCNEDDEEIKDAFNCKSCNMIFYTHRFKNVDGNVVIPIFGETDETGHPTKFNWNDLEALRDTLVENYMGAYRNQSFGGMNPESPEAIKVLEQSFEQSLKEYFKSDLEATEGCLHNYEWSNHCGAKVCNACGDHKGLARCYCGWGDIQPGERLEDDVPY